jgi:hypothetical protein
MNEDFEVLLDRYSAEIESRDSDDIPLDDDRYPGSFFRIPRPPIAGQTGWSLR